MNKVARTMTIAVILYFVFRLAIRLGGSDFFEWRTGIIGPICIVIALIICPAFLIPHGLGKVVTMFVGPMITSVLWALAIGLVVDKKKAQAKNILKTVTIAAGVLAIFAGMLLLRHLDTFYWTTGVIALISEIAVAIICPTMLIPHVTSLREPSFVEPVLSSLVWAMVIGNVIGKRRKKRARDEFRREKADDDNSLIEHPDGGPQS